MEKCEHRQKNGCRSVHEEWWKSPPWRLLVFAFVRHVPFDGRVPICVSPPASRFSWNRSVQMAVYRQGLGDTP